MAPKKLTAVNTAEELEDISTAENAMSDKKPVKITKKRGPRVKKVKVNPRTPTVVKVKIRRPTKKAKETSLSETTDKPEKYGIKDLGQQHLIDLANEVALAQLVNNSSPKLEVKVATIKTKKETKPKKELSETAGAEKVSGKGKRKIAAVSKAKKKSISKTPAVSKIPAKRKKKGDPATSEAPVEMVEQKLEVITTVANETVADTVITPVKRPRGRPRLQPLTAPVVKPETVPKPAEGKKHRVTRSSIVSPTPSKQPEFDFTSVTPKIEDVAETVSKSATIDSRKTSVSDTFSWAQDISSSSVSTPSSRPKSTTICVNGTVPVIKVVDCMKHRTKHDVRKAAVTKKRKITPKLAVTPKQPRIETPLMSTLSSPSSKSVTSASTSVNDNTVNLARALDKIRQTLNSLDLEFLKWLATEEDGNVTSENPINEDTLKLLQLEAVSLKLCQNRRALSVNSASENSVKNDSVKSDEIRESAPKLDSAAEMLPAATEGSVDNSIPLAIPEREDTDIGHDSFSDIVRQKSYEVKMSSYIDDDDALSLFAQSITELESPRFTNPVPTRTTEVDVHKTKHNHEPVKLPTVPNAMQAPKPSTIKPKEINFQSNKAKIVCEKQNADSSTSIINKEQKSLGADNFIPPPIPQLQERQPKKEQNILKPTGSPKESYLLSSTYPAMRTSIVFKGYCFFNLASNCQKNGCRYRHSIPPFQDVMQRLNSLTDDYFIMEYLLLRQHPQIKKSFIQAFAAVCIAKHLTNVLIEISMDVFTEEKTLRTHIVEVTLLHLNDKILEDYSSLLMHKLDSTTHVCDMYMKEIAYTQNFARFKPVFVNLTNIMVQSKLQFNIDVAKHIFERVCILPYDESLSRALIQIIKNTKVDIFSHNFMSMLEDRLASNNSALYGELLKCKRFDPIGNVGPKPLISEQMVYPGNMHSDRENKRYTSPDTTHLDALNKPIVDTPIITRTINLGQTRTYIPTPSVGLAANFNSTSGTPSPSSDVAEDHYKRPDESYRPKGKYKGTWRRGNGASFQPRFPSIFNRMMFRPPSTRGRYGARGNPGNYPRPPRPGFY
ncbi:hypothetical protein JYU34_012254 [Plutella xylostella]|uniref:C3H1-type domain-containing protein n=1 Tax=Plutella xylostella TaxID=51655 RepID=A0ABQ7QES5_PLUXY|nr:hypothetical protein JYU34_012254 [Plutella xylostella]